MCLYVVDAVSHVIYLHLFHPRFPFLRLRFFPVWMYLHLNWRYQINISERQNLPHSVWNCSKTYRNLLAFFSPHTEISRLILSVNNWCCWLNSVCAVRLAAFGLWWMRSFASQGQASSVNRFRFDDVVLLCCVLPCTGNQTVPIKLGFRLRLFVTDLLWPSFVLVVVRNHEDRHHDLNGIFFFVKFKHPLRDQHKSVCWPSYVGHFMLAISYVYFQLRTTAF